MVYYAKSDDKIEGNYNLSEEGKHSTNKNQIPDIDQMPDIQKMTHS